MGTRGVPGTHDLQMLSTCIESLKGLPKEKELHLPRFDKSTDDRAKPPVWPTVVGPVDVIILEGWCVGSSPQEDSALLQAINSLEEEQDSSGRWRRFVNDQLAGAYATLFAQLDALIFLRVPDFDAVYRWRLEQEEKLASTTTALAAMSAAQVARFVQHFERITRENLLVMPSKADVMLEFDDNHDCTGSYLPSAWRRDLI